MRAACNKILMPPSPTPCSSSRTLWEVVLLLWCLQKLSLRPVVGFALAWCRNVLLLPPSAGSTMQTTSTHIWIMPEPRSVWKCPLGHIRITRFTTNAQTLQCSLGRKLGPGAVYAPDSESAIRSFCVAFLLGSQMALLVTWLFIQGVVKHAGGD